MICSVYKKTSTAAPQTSSTSTTTSSTAGSTSSTTQGTTQPTTTSGSTGLIVSTQARCGTSEIDAREHCGDTCETNVDCPSGQYCWGVYDNCKLWNNRYSHLSILCKFVSNFFHHFPIPPRLRIHPQTSLQQSRPIHTVDSMWQDRDRCMDVLWTGGTLCNQLQFFIHSLAHSHLTPSYFSVASNIVRLAVPRW